MKGAQDAIYCIVKRPLRGHIVSPSVFLPFVPDPGDSHSIDIMRKRRDNLSPGEEGGWHDCCKKQKGGEVKGLNL